MQDLFKHPLGKQRAAHLRLLSVPGKVFFSFLFPSLIPQTVPVLDYFLL